VASFKSKKDIISDNSDDIDAILQTHVKVNYIFITSGLACVFRPRSILYLPVKA